VQRAIIAFVVLVFLLIGALTSREIVDRRNAETHSFELQSRNVSRSLAQQASDSFQTMDSVLVDLTETIGAKGTGPERIPALRQVIRAQVAALPILHNVFVISPTGDLLVDAFGHEKVNYRDRAWFIYARTHRDLGTYIGAAVRSRTAGQWVIPIQRRLNHRDGTFAGIALAAIRVRYFETLYDAVDVGKFGAVTLLRDDGRILVRDPLQTSVLGKPFGKAAWFRRIDPSSAFGLTAGRSAVDGVLRFNSFSRVPRYPVTVLVGMSEDEVLSEWRWESLIDVAEVAAVLLLLAVLGYYLLRQVRVRAAAERELSRFALVDGLTGLGNRRHLDDVLEREWLRAMRARAPFSFLMIDADGFKAYNDHYGHRAGDRVLKTIAACIAAAVGRPEDCAVRYGGEEFAVLLPGTDEAGAYRVAESIRNAVAARAIPHIGKPGFVTVSVGLATLRPERGTGSGTIVEAADAALYEAKRNGRNRTEVAVRHVPVAGA
jgi:diguanylate cyclase (GGDEF)-like protein